MAPSPKVFTEQDYNDSFLDTLDSINISQLDKKVPDWRERTARGDTVRIGVHGRDYVDNYGGTSGGIIPRLLSPTKRIETTLGSYGVEATKDNITTYDTYDWDTRVHLNPFTPYGFTRNAMNYLGTPHIAPDNEKIKIRIKTKRK